MYETTDFPISPRQRPGLPGTTRHNERRDHLELLHKSRRLSPDVTRQSGLGISLFGMGVAVGRLRQRWLRRHLSLAVGQSHSSTTTGNGNFTSYQSGTGPNEFLAGRGVDYDRDGKNSIWSSPIL